MQNVSQKEAADAMPLAKVESARFWRDGRFRGMECLSATFLTHEYAPHAHDTFSIGAIESGSQIATLSALNASGVTGTVEMALSVALMAGRL